jgi:hypothetical protein
MEIFGRSSEDAHALMVRDGIMAPERHALAFLRDFLSKRELALSPAVDAENDKMLLESWLEHLGGVSRFLGIHAPTNTPEVIFEVLCGVALAELLAVRLSMKGGTVTWSDMRMEVATLSLKDKQALAVSVLSDVRAKLSEQGYLLQNQIL